MSARASKLRLVHSADLAGASSAGTPRTHAGAVQAPNDPGPRAAPPRRAPEDPPALPAYAELHCLSNFSFLRGASTARELIERAKALGYSALAITDECSMAGIVRAHEAATELEFPLIIGTELRLADGPRLVLLATSHAGYTALCRLITLGRRAADKGEYHLTRADCAALGEDVLALWLPPPVLDDPAVDDELAWTAQTFPQRAWVAVELHRGADDAVRSARLRALAAGHGLPAVASGDVHMHARGRRALQDALTAIRLGTTLAEAGDALFPNGERHLRPRADLAQLHAQAPELLAESTRIAARCRFSLAELRYTYPHELVPEGRTPAQHLRELTEQGVAWRFPHGAPPTVRAQVEHELALIAELSYESYFLTVHDIVRHARAQKILCQGRGSAANSAVCFCLGITEVDPARMSMLFERFISKERNEPPDIDVDFEHERREEVIQYVYRKYGRERAALAATVISYRPKSAVRDLGKALGLSLDQVERISGALGWWDGEAVIEERIREQGFDPASPVIRKLVHLARELMGFPRHLSQHVGGFVISERPLCELVPVENAAMPERTIIQWDKDDLDALGLLKVDCLALGMLSCIRRAFDLVHDFRSRVAALAGDAGPDKLTLATIPAEDAATYHMIQRADTLGVFQIESRAQMAMLPRLKPKCFYDLVIEVAIVRPGPIQGRMVHPYLRRRQGLEPVEFPSPELEAVFGRTLGVPIFQEQVMHLAIVAAGFTPGEADRLRRSMAAWKRHGGLEHYKARITEGMLARGYAPDFAEQIFEQIKGFGSYGFPESHAASFALLVYGSCWLKCHEPAAFAAALINAQPMGFYQPAQIIQDVRRHGVEVRPVDVRWSDWDCTLELDSAQSTVRPERSREAPESKDSAARSFDSGGLRPPTLRTNGEQMTEAPRHPQPAIRLGLRLVRGLSEACANRIVAARTDGPFRDVQDLVERADLNRFEQARLADAGALRSLAGHRHRARWQVEGVERAAPVLEGARIDEERVTLVPPREVENIDADYATLGLSLERHPLALIRTKLRARGALDSKALLDVPHHRRVRTAGLVTVRQRPSTASGVTFLTLEDEAGTINVVVWLKLAQEQRRELLESRLLAIDGRIERAEGVQHLIAERLHDWTAMVPRLDARSRDFH